MKHRLLRLAVAAGAAVAVTAPLTQPAQAFMCAPGFEVVCFAVGTACREANDATFGRMYCQFG